MRRTGKANGAEVGGNGYGHEHGGNNDLVQAPRKLQKLFVARAAKRLERGGWETGCKGEDMKQRQNPIEPMSMNEGMSE
jgi:hypothetical protein